MAALTETEARVRAALLDVWSYDVFLDLTAGPTGPVRSRAEIRFGCREPGAATFADLTAVVTSAVLNGRAVGPAVDGRLGLRRLAAENVLVVEAEVAGPGGGRGRRPDAARAHLVQKRQADGDGTCASQERSSIQTSRVAHDVL